jgi:hypothetical protein
LWIIPPSDFVLQEKMLYLCGLPRATYSYATSRFSTLFSKIIGALAHLIIVRDACQAATRSAARGIVAAVKKDREPSEN